jgi:hypothetical protein
MADSADDHDARIDDALAQDEDLRTASPAIVVLFQSGPASTQAIQYARSLTADVHAVHVRADEADTLALRRAWEEFDIPLVILPAERRAIAPPILHYIESVHSQKKAITVVLAEAEHGRLFATLSQRRAALAIRRSLQSAENVTIASVRC